MPSPNEQQILYWNEQAGPRWVALAEPLDRELAPLGEAAMDRVGIREGHRVLDVGCGGGAATLAIARRTGPTGSVLGVDVSRPLLAHAEARRDARGLANVRFELADAQVTPFAPGSADIVFSRFGIMFFSDPQAAFANLRRALAPGGRIGFVCWQPADKNPVMALAARAASARVALPTPGDPHAPGPFAFADGDRTRRILEGAGFASVLVEPVEIAVSIAGDLDEAAGFLMQLGPAAAALRDASPDIALAVRGELRAAIEPYATNGGIVMPAAVWIATGVEG